MLHYSSFHPKHVKDSIPYSQTLRIHRICSYKEDRDLHLNTLRSALVRDGYHAKLIDEQFHRATSKNREELLNRTIRTETKPRTPFVTTYFPGADQLRKTLRQTQHLIDSDPYLSEVLPQPPLLAIRQPPNLKRTLIRSKLPEPSPTQHGTRSCQKTRCRTCQLIDESTTVTRDNTTLTIHGKYTCNSTGVVYLIRCRKNCSDAWYIGETKQTLRERMNGHRATIRNCSTLPVGEHFSTHGHTESDIQLNILQGNLHTTHERRIAEQKLIAKFHTHDNGLNKDLGFMARYN